MVASGGVESVLIPKQPADGRGDTFEQNKVEFAFLVPHHKLANFGGESVEFGKGIKALAQHSAFGIAKDPMPSFLGVVWVGTRHIERPFEVFVMGFEEAESRFFLGEKVRDLDGEFVRSGVLGKADLAQVPDFFPRFGIDGFSDLLEVWALVNYSALKSRASDQK